jgi:hypothetical protein
MVNLISHFTLLIEISDCITKEESSRNAGICEQYQKGNSND